MKIERYFLYFFHGNEFAILYFQRPNMLGTWLYGPKSPMQIGNSVLNLEYAESEQNNQSIRSVYIEISEENAKQFVLFGKQIFNSYEEAVIRLRDKKAYGIPLF